MIARYAYVFPVAAALLAATIRFGFVDVTQLVVLVATALLLGTAFSAVQHAELVSDRIGQPYGTLVLTFSVTLIEVSVLVSLMMNGGNNPTLAREAVLSTVMFVLSGGGRHLPAGGWVAALRADHPATGRFRLSLVIMAIAVLGLILPGQTWGGASGLDTQIDVIVIMFGVVLLYGSFLFMQTVRHRSDFVAGEDHHEAMPTRGRRSSRWAFCW